MEKPRIPREDNAGDAESGERGRSDAAPRGVRAGLIRLLDANLNRAAEALRVADDLARFVLDDQGLCSRFKSIRHGLAHASAGVDGGVRLAVRDTAGDVGTAVSASGEFERRSVAAVAASAGGRAAEAMRSIEEACKVLGAAAAAREVEGLRYLAYDAFAALGLKLGAGGAKQWSLCVLITESLCQQPWERVVERAIEGGADCVQLREKDMEGGRLLERAKRLVELAKVVGGVGGLGGGGGVKRPAIIINDRPDVAMLAGADGVHLGQQDLPVDAVRKLAGFTLAVGVSTANLEQARRANADGADYVGLGPMFVSNTKPKPSLSGVEYLRAFLGDPELAKIPHLAISGITPGNLGELAKAGCRGVAVSSVVCGADDPRAVCEELVRALRGDH